MNKSELEKRINGLNEYCFSNKKLKLLTISNIYTYNKAVAIQDKNEPIIDWYSADNKTCFKTRNEVEAFINGICIGKNIDFER